MTHCFCDFEYNDRQVILGCFLVDGKRFEIDFRDGAGRDELAALLTVYGDRTWVSYAAMAEMSSILRLGQSLPRDWVDLRAEAVMITGTHSAFRCFHPGLLDHLRVFDLPIPETDKEGTRDLIIHNDAWSVEEWSRITTYCWSDVDALPGLYEAIQLVHQAVPTVWEEAHALNRGDYLRASAMLDHRSLGLPINEPMLRSIFANRAAIRNALAEECNAHYGHPIYRKKLDTIEKLADGSRRAKVSYSLSHEGLEAYLQSLPFPPRWERTPSGRLSLEDSYLDDLIKDQPSLKEFRYTRSMLAQLNSDGLVERIEPGSHIRPLSLPFYTTTGRNQPMAARGFLLNLPPWLRHVIRPHPGRVLIACDWSKQEIAIAAVLSGDEGLLAAYNAGDIYLELGKMAGAIPPDGTKDSHELERQAYKSVQLGLGYGMGRTGLAKSLYADLNMGRDVPVITREEADRKAAEIIAWHKKAFPKYWAYLKRESEDAVAKGYTTSVDGWFYFADRSTKATQLMNYPMQSNGAAMLREAIKTLAFETDLDVVCSLHDAIYVQCDEADQEIAIATLQDAMNRAVEKVIGTTAKIAVDPKVFTHATGYVDKRGTKTLERIQTLLATIANDNPSLEEIVPNRRAKIMTGENAA